MRSGISRKRGAGSSFAAEAQRSLRSQRGDCSDWWWRCRAAEAWSILLDATDPAADFKLGFLSISATLKHPPFLDQDCSARPFAKKMKTSFWTYFTSGYGTLWLVLLGLGLVTQSHIDAGLFGLIGFPTIAVVYALIRRSRDNEVDAVVPICALPPKMAEFLNAHPEFLNAQQKIRDQAFHRWLNSPELQ